MAVLLADGFDWTKTSGLYGPWSSVAGTGPDSDWTCDGNGTWFSDSNSARYLAMGVDSKQTLIINMRVALTVGGPSSELPLISVSEPSTQATLAILSSGAFRVYRGLSTTLGTSSTGLIAADGEYHDIEFKIKIDNSPNGTYEVKLDGVTVLSGTGDTQANSDAFATIVRVGKISGINSWADVEIDHVIIMDTTGSEMNDFIGSVRVSTLFVTGEGNYSDWTSNTGTGWQAVDDFDPDGNTTYISATDTGDKSTFTYEDLPAGVDIVYAVGIQSYIDRSDSLQKQVSPILRSGGVDYNGSSVDTPSTFSMSVEWLEQSPFTTGDWTGTEVNNIEAGIEVET